MLCCAILLALFTMPALAISRRSWRHKVDPLAWRLACAAPVSVPPASFARQLRLLIRNRVRSFAFAGAGVRHVICNERVSLIHGFATAAAFGTGFLLNITAKDWRWIVFAVLLVWSAEAFNTAIESVCNLLSPELSEHVRIAKDVGAGGVLLVSIGAAVIGLLTFWPYLAPTWPTAADLSLALPLCTAP
jgi:diacylglycerol kinase (ATP)